MGLRNVIGIEDSIKGTPKCSINPPKQKGCVAIYVSLYQMVNKLTRKIVQYRGSLFNATFGFGKICISQNSHLANVNFGLFISLELFFGYFSPKDLQ